MVASTIIIHSTITSMSLSLTLISNDITRVIRVTTLIHLMDIRIRSRVRVRIRTYSYSES